MKQLFKVTAATFVAGFMVSQCWAEEEKILNIYNWYNYIGETTISDFEKETGIKVRYDTFDSAEILEAKLVAGNSGYDVVVPSSGQIERYKESNVFLPLDKSKLANLKNLDSAIMQRLATQDPENRHALPWAWGTVGIGYNVEKVNAVLKNPPTDSWDLIFKEEYASKIAGCGIGFLDSPSEVFPVALNYLGLDPNSTDKGEIKKATELLKATRPFIKYFNSSQLLDDMVTGEVCVVLDYNGDVSIGMVRAEEAGQDIQLAYSIPKEGTIIWFDTMAIPSDAPHSANAHLFLDYMLRPESAAGITNTVFFASPNTAAIDLINPEILADPGIYPPDDVKQKLFGLKVLPQKIERLYTRAWTSIKTGI